MISLKRRRLRKSTKVTTIPAVAVSAGLPDSVHITSVRKPEVTDVADGLGVLIRSLYVGLDATDREINEGLYGTPPDGEDELVVGHEFVGRVEEVGDNVENVNVGDWVTLTVRRPGSSTYDAIDRQDITTDDEYYERGISKLHGTLTQFVVENCKFVVKIPKRLGQLGVLVEPMSCVQKAIDQALEANRRHQVWKPKTALVLGSGQIGILAVVALRLRGIKTACFDLADQRSEKASIVESLGATFTSAANRGLGDVTAETGQPDLILEATGSSQLAFEAMHALNRNGVMVWMGITGGKTQKTVDSDKISLDWVLGNKTLMGSVNARYEDFEAAISDICLAETTYPGVLNRLLTSRHIGMESFPAAYKSLAEATSIKVFIDLQTPAHQSSARVSACSQEVGSEYYCG